MRHPRWLRRWRHSLRLRLITVFLLLALAMAAVFLAGMQRAVSAGWREAARPLVSDYIDRLAAELGSPPDPGRAQALAGRLPITVRIEGPQVNWQSSPQRPVFQPRLNRDDDWLSRATPDGHRIHFGLSALQDGPRGIGWLTLALLLGLIAVAYAYVRRLLRPLDDIRAGAERFGRGTFDTPIPLRRPDELGDLAQRINTMAHDIEGMHDAKRGLLLALSHELRSPLTRARLNAELLPTTPEGTGAGEHERAALLRDLGEMRDLISDLLESERLASPHAALNREPVDLAALVRDTVADMPAPAAITLALEPGLAPLALDRTRVRLLVRNLLDNALRYSAGAAQPPVISLAREAGGVRLQVRDFGPGVDASQLARLTEPFYRTDSARQRTTGGVGLGMYLCQLVARAHGAPLEVGNAEPGLRVAVLFPYRS
ncbi:MAG: histidine kinase [Polaromonas sp.]|nr:histidine kinase [Polaromonas sp.]